MVNEKVIPSLQIHDPIEDMTVVKSGTVHPGWHFDDQTDHENGGDGGATPWNQPAVQGDWWNGKQHTTPEDKLRDAEYKSLSPVDKIKYDAENASAMDYQKDYFQWEYNGKQGPAPAKPDTPQHDKVEAAVKADETAIEKQVRQSMTPDERAKYDAAKAAYEKECSGTKISSIVPVPPELAEFNKKIATAVGLNTESWKDFNHTASTSDLKML